MSNGNGAKDYTQMSDLALYEAICERQEEALATFYDRHATQVYGLAMEVLHQQDLAAQALRNAFIMVWHQCEAFKHLGFHDPVYWLMATARREALNLMRTHDVHRRREALVDRREASTGMARFIQEEQRNVERRWVVSKAMETLPLEQRLLIDMAFFEGLSEGQISERLKRPVESIRTRLAQGIKKLASSVVIR
ncbi:MAG: sigma-70 family RNA polymerase sigma factor [Calditrichaeota bacterium]|nr:sigma-70 family RNA polymerase sigma factor [Calditrichota bacterium]HQU74542.1 sigma-70 family RNA polymerase sigma factor [Calditrichia bacterium]